MHSALLRPIRTRLPASGLVAAWIAATFAVFAGRATGGEAGTRVELQGAITLPDQVPDADGKPVA